MGGQKPLACLNVVVLCLVVDKVLRSEDSETLLIVLVISQKRIVARRVKIVQLQLQLLGSGHVNI